MRNRMHIIERGENGGYIYTYDYQTFFVQLYKAYAEGFETLAGARESLYYQTH